MTACSVALPLTHTDVAQMQVTAELARRQHLLAALLCWRGFVKILIRPCL